MDERANRVFHVLAPALRLGIAVHPLDGEHPVSGLARRYPMSFAVLAWRGHVAQRGEKPCDDPFGGT